MWEGVDIWAQRILAGATFVTAVAGLIGTLIGLRRSAAIQKSVNGGIHRVVEEVPRAVADRIEPLLPMPPRPPRDG